MRLVCRIANKEVETTRVYHPKNMGQAMSLIKKLPGCHRSFRLIDWKIDGTSFTQVKHAKMAIKATPKIAEAKKLVGPKFNPTWIKAMLPHWGSAFMGNEL